MNTDQEQRLANALHTARQHPDLAVDLTAVLTTAHRARRRRRLGEALVATTGIVGVAAAGLWVVDVLPGPASDLTPAGVSVPAAEETYGVEDGPDTGMSEASTAIQRAGQAAQERQYDCMESRGVPIERFADGSAQIGPVAGDSPGGVDQTHRQMRLCRAQAGFPEVEPLGTEQISQLYALNLDAAQCLQGHGYDPAPAVSETEFTKTYDAALTEPETLRWTPYQTIDDPAAVELCPEPSLQD